MTRCDAAGHCASEHRYREWIFGQFLAWTLSGFVVGLVRAQFYVTESMGQKHALRFYRAEVWNKLQEMAFRCAKQQSCDSPDTCTYLSRNPKLSLILGHCFHDN